MRRTLLLASVIALMAAGPKPDACWRNMIDVRPPPPLNTIQQDRVTLCHDALAAMDAGPEQFSRTGAKVDADIESLNADIADDPQDAEQDAGELRMIANEVIVLGNLEQAFAMNPSQEMWLRVRDRLDLLAADATIVTP